MELSGGAEVVLAFNKPVGVISTMADEQGRPCIRNYVDETWGRVFHVGRLDQESSGLLILTNRGDLSHQLAHPKHEIQKTYLVDVLTSDKDLFVKRVLQGVMLPEGLSKADRCELVASPSRLASAPTSTKRLLWQLHDGRNRVIRRVAEALNAKVLKLHRVAVGNYLMTSTRAGQVVQLSPKQVDQLTQPPSTDLINSVIRQSSEI